MEKNYGRNGKKQPISMNVRCADLKPQVRTLNGITRAIIEVSMRGLKMINKEQTELLEKYYARLTSDIEFWESKIRQLESSIHYYQTKIQDANIEMSRVSLVNAKNTDNQVDFQTAKELYDIKNG